MNKTTIRTIALSGAVLLSTIALAGCTINLGSSDADQNSGMMGNGGMMGNNSSSSAFSGADIMFAQMMIPHHQQAVDMGTLAETRASSPEVKALAAQIKAEQAPEIEQMKGWLKAANASLDMGHDMGMGGMLTESDMTALKNATGAAFDRLYLEGMIGHHKGAIHMAQMVIDSNNAEANKLGHAIIDSQTKQIAYMESLLKK
ncbi:MAG: hypothetical protein RL036_43 [Actinomycetota bacterium]